MTVDPQRILRREMQVAPRLRLGKNCVEVLEGCGLSPEDAIVKYEYPYPGIEFLGLEYATENALRRAGIVVISQAREIDVKRASAPWLDVSRGKIRQFGKRAAADLVNKLKAYDHLG